MRVAPPVQALSCSAGPWQSIQVALYALSTAVAVWWAGAHLGQTGTLLALVSLLAGLVAAIVARGALSEPALRLAWDGSAWRLQPPRGEGPAGRVALMLDLGGWMLVRFTPSSAGRWAWGGATWLPLCRRDVASAWPTIRVALHAPQPLQPTA